MQETWVQTLGWEDPLEEGMATHSSTPAWRIPWIEKSAATLQGYKESTQLKRLSMRTFRYRYRFIDADIGIGDAYRMDIKMSIF